MKNKFIFESTVSKVLLIVGYVCAIIASVFGKTNIAISLITSAIALLCVFLSKLLQESEQKTRFKLATNDPTIVNYITNSTCAAMSFFYAVNNANIVIGNRSNAYLAIDFISAHNPEAAKLAELLTSKEIRYDDMVNMAREQDTQRNSTESTLIMRTFSDITVEGPVYSNFLLSLYPLYTKDENVMAGEGDIKNKIILARKKVAKRTLTAFVLLIVMSILNPQSELIIFFGMTSLFYIIYGVYKLLKLSHTLKRFNKVIDALSDLALIDNVKKSSVGAFSMLINYSIPEVTLFVKKHCPLAYNLYLNNGASIEKYNSSIALLYAYDIDKKTSVTPEEESHYLNEASRKAPFATIYDNGIFKLCELVPYEKLLADAEAKRKKKQNKFKLLRNICFGGAAIAYIILMCIAVNYDPNGSNDLTLLFMPLFSVFFFSGLVFAGLYTKSKGNRDNNK